MGIFSKNDKQSKSQIGTTVVGNDTSIKGVIDTKGSVYIDGKFEGIVVATNDVIIGVHGEVLGEIRAKTLTVNGLIDGMMSIFWGAGVFERTISKNSFGADGKYQWAKKKCS